MRANGKGYMDKKGNEKIELRPDSLVNLIRERIVCLEQLVIEKEKAIKIAPEGRLRIDQKGNALQYYHRKDPSNLLGVYINREQDSLASALAQKDYDCKLVRELKAEIKALRRFLCAYRPDRIDNIYLSFHDFRKQLICPVKYSDEVYVQQWLSVEYETKKFDEDTTDYYSAKGERVRSKSEIIIADTLNRFNIPYRYEYPIHISDIGIVHPDFTCLNVRKRKEYLWEHNGMMLDSEYADYAYKKIEKYVLAGFCPGENLILSFETTTHPLSSRVIECYIRKYLL